MMPIWNIRVGFTGVCLIVVLTSGCHVSRWFNCLPGNAETPHLSAELQPPPPGNGYLSAGPTFNNVQAVHQAQETGIERAIRLQIENEQLSRALTERDRQIDELRHRLESKEQLLNRLEPELQQSIEEVNSASERIRVWNEELAKLHAQTRGDTAATSSALELLSKRVEALTRQQAKSVAPTAATLETPAVESEEPRVKRQGLSVEDREPSDENPRHELPAPVTSP